MLGWYEATGDERALTAVRRAVDVTMRAYPLGQSHPFDVEDDFAGVGHGLVFTDILDRLYQLTGETQYLAYAPWLYEEYNRQPLSQNDIQISHLLDPDYRFKAHGVHTYEHLRSLLTAAYATEDSLLDSALAAALAKLETCLTSSGAPIGDEFIAGREADTSGPGMNIVPFMNCSTPILTCSRKPVMSIGQTALNGCSSMRLKAHGILLKVRLLI